MLWNKSILLKIIYSLRIIKQVLHVSIIIIIIILRKKTLLIIKIFSLNNCNNKFIINLPLFKSNHHKIKCFFVQIKNQTQFVQTIQWKKIVIGHLNISPNLGKTFNKH